MAITGALKSTKVRAMVTGGLIECKESLPRNAHCIAQWIGIEHTSRFALQYAATIAEHLCWTTTSSPGYYFGRYASGMHDRRFFSSSQAALNRRDW